jgi:hypothetical protein
MIRTSRTGSGNVQLICISASFGPSTVRVNTETVYSGRCEAGVVMASIGKAKYWDWTCPVMRLIGT